MEVNIFYNVPHYRPLGIPIAFYFYLTGLSAGSFVISVVSLILGKVEYKALGKISAVLAPLLLTMAPATLIIDLEQPLRFWYLFLYLNFTSPITYGSFLLTAYPIHSLIYAFFFFRDNVKMAKLLGSLGIPLALATHGYTGFILALGKGRALWSTALMPTLFIVSAMVSGIALVILIAVIRNRLFMKNKPAQEIEKDKNLIIGLGKILGATILADLFLVSNDVLVLLTAKQEEYHVAQLILFGDFAPLFVGVEIVLGAIIPLFLIFVPYTSKRLVFQFIASLLVMVGIFAMRVMVVLAGQSIPLH
ncbi:MAG: polysulfide reductase NrfD [Deltaproteobacteria bacterium]|nr:polysulfide reductase NrfD [Deltaproteobacteria bacterium]MBW2308061.1 polysulfide reductase NrfD [Deltaproteobacteria bacterium]